MGTCCSCDALNSRGLRDRVSSAYLGECKLRIFHINDVYQLDRLPALRTCIEQLSVGLPRSNVLTTLSGDFLAPSLLSSLDHGRGMVDVMNHVPIDAVCFGNHESDVPYVSLCQRIDEYQGAWLNSNMRTFQPELPKSHLIELEGGRSVLLLGFCIGGGNFSKVYRDGAFGGAAKNISQILDCVDHVVEEQITCHSSAGSSIDAVIPLTHQDMPEDIEMTAKERKFPVILGGHDHEEFNEVHNGTLVIKAGQDALKCAVIDLVWKEGTPRPSPPTSVTVQLHDLPHWADSKGSKFEPDPELVDLVKRWQRPAEELKVAVLDEVQPGRLSSVGVRAGESTMATFIASAMRTACRAQGALINAGGVRGDKVYETGQITFADLSKECPFPSANIVVIMDGKTLSDAVQKSREKWRASPPETDALALHGDDEMTVCPTTGAVLKVQNKALRDAQEYTILIDSYLMDANPVLKEFKAKHPERIPPDDSGAPSLPTLVQYFGERVWEALVRDDHNGALHLDELDKILEASDKFSENGELNEEQLLKMIEKKLGPNRASRVLASTCLAFADEDKSGGVSRCELRKFLIQGLAARLGICVAISIDKLLYNEHGVYEWSPEGCKRAWERVYEQFKELAESNMCRKIVCMCGCPGVGKSTWLRLYGPQMGTDCIFFDDLLYSKVKRKMFLDGLVKADIQAAVEIVAIERDLETSIKAVNSREIGGVRVPPDAMQRFSREYERPSVEEGFHRVRIYENTYDDETKHGGYVLIKELPHVLKVEHFFSTSLSPDKIVAVDSMHTASESNDFSHLYQDAWKHLNHEVSRMTNTGECKRIIVTCGVSQASQDAWIRLNGAVLGGPDSIFISSMLHTVKMRSEFLESLRNSNIMLPVEIIAVERTEITGQNGAALRLGTRRMSCGPSTRQLIQDPRNKLQKEYSRPTIEEGFARVTVVTHLFNARTGSGDFVDGTEDVSGFPEMPYACKIQL